MLTEQDEKQQLEAILQQINEGQYQQAYAGLHTLQNLVIDSIETARQIGACLWQLEKHDELLSLLEQVTQYYPNDPGIEMLYGLETGHQGDVRGSIRHFIKSIRLNSNDPTIYYNLGCIFQQVRKYQWAKKCYEKSIEKFPRQVASYLNLAVVSKYLGLYEEIEQYYKKLLSLDANHVDAHVNLGMYYLSVGDYEQGWPEYEWRLQSVGLKDISKRFTEPRWRGESLKNKSLIIFAEQGLGDAIQFVRYIPYINRNGGKIYLECDPVLKRLLANSFKLHKIILTGEELPQYDYYCPLLSLPGLFKTDISTIPNEVPYLYADRKSLKKWKKYFSNYKKTFKIGIVWAGKETYRNDFYRSMRPELFTPIAKDSRFSVFSLQKTASQAVCEEYGFIPLGNQFEDLMDAAGAISELDLVIAVDTSLLHLAGALNKPAWGLLSFIHDWRWLNEGDGTPWYPSIKLYRQQQRGEWEPIIQQMKEDLERLIMYS